MISRLALGALAASVSASAARPPAAVVASFRSIVETAGICEEATDKAFGGLKATGSGPEMYVNFLMARTACGDTSIALAQISTPPLPVAAARRWHSALMDACVPAYKQRSDAFAHFTQDLEKGSDTSILSRLVIRVDVSRTLRTHCMVELASIAKGDSR